MMERIKFGVAGLTISEDIVTLNGGSGEIHLAAGTEGDLVQQSRDIYAIPLIQLP